MATGIPLNFDTVKCMICKDRIATVQVKIWKPMEVNILACAFCAGFPESELVGRVLKKEDKNKDKSTRTNEISKLITLFRHII